MKVGDSVTTHYPPNYYDPHHPSDGTPGVVTDWRREGGQDEALVRMLLPVECSCGILMRWEPNNPDVHTIELWIPRPFLEASC